MQDFNAYEQVMAQWFDLMQDAQQKNACFLQQDVESYLVLLLMRFTERPELATVTFAEDYLQASQESGRLQHEKMRDVADGCLLHAGFFPGRSERKNVSDDYFIELGRLAYRSLTVLPEKVWTGPYAELELSIDDAAQVLAFVQSPRSS